MSPIDEMEEKRRSAPGYAERVNLARDFRAHALRYQDMYERARDRAIEGIKSGKMFYTGFPSATYLSEALTNREIARMLRLWASELQVLEKDLTE